MKARFAALSLLVGPLACSSAAREPAAPPAPSPLLHITPAEPAPAPEPVSAPEPTEEEKKAQAAAEKLAQDRAQMRADSQAELARWTPELREQARALAGKNYTGLKPAMKEVLAGAHRMPGNAERDAHRHPVETLEFFGLKPTMTVLEYGPGAGWYTELLAPVLAQRGKLIVTTADPKGPPESRATLYAERLDHFLNKSPELFGKVERAVFDAAAPQLNVKEQADMALVIRGMHGWVRDDKMGLWLEQIHSALKPNGVLGIVQHRAAQGADPKESAPSGYLPEAWVVEQVQAAGFRLTGKSEVNANPKDTRDHEAGVWSLPPNLSLGDKDREKYEAIGESDRMTLRFVKVARPKVAGAP